MKASCVGEKPGVKFMLNPAFQSIHPSNHQSIDQPTDQPKLNQSTDQPINQSTPQSVDETIYFLSSGHVRAVNT